MSRSMDFGALVWSMGCRCSVRLHGWILGLPISLPEKKKNGESSEVSDAYTHSKYLSEMIDKPSKRRQ
jgi:hypothetical protein